MYEFEPLVSILHSHSTSNFHYMAWNAPGKQSIAASLQQAMAKVFHGTRLGVAQHHGHTADSLDSPTREISPLFSVPVFSGIRNALNVCEANNFDTWWNAIIDKNWTEHDK